MGKLRLRCAVQISDYRHCILRVCSKRPRRCATDKGYEVAPFHYRPLARGQCSVAIKPILLKRECPLWVKSRHMQCKRHVRFTPKSGHVRCKQECPLWAKSGHCDYSMT